MSATAVRAGRAFVEVFADTGPLAQGLKKAGRMLVGWSDGLKSVGKKLALVGAVGVSGFLAATKSMADMSGQIDDMSQRTGVGVESLSALKFAAEQTGATLDDLGDAFKNINNLITDAEKGADDARKKLAAVGLTIEDIKDLPADKVMERLATAIQSINSPAKQSSAALDLMGKKGLALLPLLKLGSLGIQAFTTEAKKRGLVFSEADIKAADEFGDRWAAAMSVVWSAVHRVGAAVIPVLMPLIDLVSDTVKHVAKWIDENRGLTVSVLAAFATVKVLGLALAYVVPLVLSVGSGVLFAAASIPKLLAAIKAVAMTTVSFTSILSGAGTVLSAMGTVIGFLLSPMGAVAVALGVIVVWLGSMVDWAAIGNAALGSLAKYFGTLAGETMRALNLMGQALASGDLSAAAEVLWAYLNLQWVKGKTAVTEVWVAMTEALVDAWRSAVFAIAKFAIEAWSGLQIAWTETVRFITDAASAVVTGWVVGWQWAIGLIEKAWIGIRSLFGEQIDVKLAMSGVDAKTQGVIDQAHAMHNQSAAARRNAANAKIDGIMANANAMTDSLASQRQAERDKRATENEKALAEAAKSLEDASAKWDAAAAKAESATAAAVESAVAGANAAGDSTSQAVSMVSGTFNPMNFRGLGGGARVDPVVSKLEELRKEVASMRKDERERPKL